VPKPDTRGDLQATLLAFLIFLLVHSACTYVGEESGFLAGSLTAGFAGAAISRLRRSSAGTIDLFMAHAIASVSAGVFFGSIGAAGSSATTFFLLDRWARAERDQQVDNRL